MSLVSKGMNSQLKFLALSLVIPLLKYNLHLVLQQVLQTQDVWDRAQYSYPPPPPNPFPSWSSSSRLVVPPSTDAWNLCVFLFLRLTFNWPPKLNSSTYVALLLSFSFLFVLSSLGLSPIFSSHVISNSIPLLILLYPLPALSPEESTKAFFCLLYLLNIYCTKAWNGTLSISLFIPCIYVCLFFIVVAVGQQVWIGKKKISTAELVN